MERPRRVPVSPEVAEFEQNIAELERALPDPEARERILMIGAALQVAHRRTHGHTPDMRMTFHPASPHPNPLGVALVITLAVILIATGNVDPETEVVQCTCGRGFSDAKLLEAHLAEVAG